MALRALRRARDSVDLASRNGKASNHAADAGRMRRSRAGAVHIRVRLWPGLTAASPIGFGGAAWVLPMVANAEPVLDSGNSKQEQTGHSRPERTPRLRPPTT